MDLLGERLFELQLNPFLLLDVCLPNIRNPRPTVNDAQQAFPHFLYHPLFQLLQSFSLVLFLLEHQLSLLLESGIEGLSISQLVHDCAQSLLLLGELVFPDGLSLHLKLSHLQLTRTLPHRHPFKNILPLFVLNALLKIQ